MLSFSTQYKNQAQTMEQMNNTSFCSSLQREETLFETSFKLIVYSIAFVAGVIGNVLVIFIVCRKKNFRTTSNLFIVNMAVSDLCLAVMVTPGTMYVIATGTKQTLFTGVAGVIVCKLEAFLQGTFVGTSVLTVLVLAADRFLAIVYPFKKIICKRKAKLLIIMVYVIAAFFNAPLLYATKFYDKDGVHHCQEIWEPYFDSIKAPRDFTIVLFVFFYVFPLLMVIFFYSAVIRELWRGKLHNSNTVAFRENKSVLKMVLTITVVFAVCWLPVHLMYFLYLFGTDAYILMCDLDPAVKFIGWFMAHINTSINPFIYFMYTESFRVEARRIIRPFLRVFLRGQLSSQRCCFSRQRECRTPSVYYSINRTVRTEQSMS